MEELARLTSGERITGATLAAAGELLDSAERFKRALTQQKYSFVELNLSLDKLAAPYYNPTQYETAMTGRSTVLCPAQRAPGLV